MSQIDLTQSTIVTAAELINLRERPLPTAPDGLYDYQANASKSGNGKDDEHSRLFTLVDGFQQAVKRGPPVTDPKAITALVDSVVNKDALDDRKGLFTNTLAAITRLPPGKLQDKLNDVAITLLYDTLPHPPATRLGTEAQYRAADGGGNSLEDYDRGRAGTHYARTVQGKQPLPPNALPDPGLVFDTLLKARDFKKHPGQNSSLTFAFASIVTHSLFRTDLGDWTKNNTSSYLDLSPVYGINQATQDAVRWKDLGRGLLYPDTFSEERLGFLPAAVSALLVIFSRNHNYIATILLKLNERKLWVDPPPTDPDARLKQDEEIFQTARLVNCGHFMSLIFGDYVAGFLGLPREGSSWSMNPFDPIKTKDGQIITRGQGNQCSVEFNVVYRWHATTAKEDIEWTEDLFSKIFGVDGKTKTFSDLTVDDVKKIAPKIFASQDPDPKKRTFGGLKRQADGTFSDDDLAKILQDATEKCAGAYRARGTPEALRVVEIMGMEQARRWGVCTMNEFRKYLGLKQFETFEEWSSDPVISEAARKLYKHIDNLELYPGLQAEDIMELGPGSGICCGFTMTRAILADAIALVRGDRFYTTDFTPANLTAWGIQDCARNPDNGAFGAALPKLLFRHLPRHYTANSVYALFPFFTPEVTKENLTRLGVVGQYDFVRPKPRPVPIVLDTLQGIRYVFNDFEKYKQTYEYDMKMLTRGYGFMLTFDEKQKHDTDRSIVMHALFPSKDSISQYTEWYKQKCLALLAEKSYSYDGVPGKYVDIIKDVINLVSVHWAADKLCGIPLKTKANPKGLFTEQEVNDMFVVLFTCVFENIDPEHTWILRNTAQKVGKIVNSLIEQSLKEAAPGSAANILTTLVSTVKNTLFPTPPKECYDFLSRLSASGKPLDDLVACVIGLAVGSSVNYSQAVAQVVDFYLSDERAAERAELINVCKRNDAASAELLRGYVREGMRLNPQFGGLFRAVAQDDIINVGQNKPSVRVHAGDVIFASFKNAHLNPIDFPDPLKVNPKRPKESYQLQGAGFHNCPGISFAEQTIPELVRIIFTLPNLRRAKGAAGVCASFDIKKMDTMNRMYISSTGTWSPWPGSLFVTYDA